MSLGVVGPRPGGLCALAFLMMPLSPSGLRRVVANSDKRIVITFVDGSAPIKADVVIGADGLKSTAKQALFPEAAGDPYPPQYECVFLIPYLSAV